MTTYVGSKLRARKAEIAVLLQQSLGKISISVDIWMSSNHLSFLGVVAHFSGKFLYTKLCFDVV
jgi:hypothetical protein